jgi:enolase-phosphatase E1
MIRFAGWGFVLDIEGTTSSIRFVYDVLFPYARRELAAFLQAHWDEPEVARARDRIARDAGAASFAAWCGGAATPAALERLCAEVNRLMDADVKATGLKDLQGLIWREGYRAGVLRSHVYPDVPPALKAWSAASRDLRIFSSGSVAAQRLFFAHTEAGDLSGYFCGHYDTTHGPKRAPASYAAIAAHMGRVPGQVLFLSDVTAELNAARQAGLATCLVERPGNAPSPPGHGHPVVRSFAQIVLE